ncbi:hypothetical protein PG991_008005 [Apiospora marii]|uniref:AB hydrolase-1 domain-containing protein n=1 Tax=Apiospora marii TaxID=335849 RepID=A0ABR1RWL7_9PEZI
MDSTSQASAPIPRYSSSHSQTRHQSRRNDLSLDPLSFYDQPRGHSSATDHSNRVTVQPASPEVISSLITSLSVISKPANSLFDGPPTLPTPTSPSDGSFGVEYGSFQFPPLSRLEEGVSLDELAASPPIIRTSKPPSGLSVITAPKSPRSPSREASGGLRSLLRSSRPSSRGSEVSSHDDTRSIGNLSVERGQTPELHRRASQDSSWGRKTSRNHKSGISAERQRGTTAAGSNSGALSPITNRPDPFLAEHPIREEPSFYEIASHGQFPGRSSSLDNYHNSVPFTIPTRDSSVRKSGSNVRRASNRRPKRESDAGFNDSIPEHEEHYNRSRDASAPPPIARRHQSFPDFDGEARRREEYLRPEMPNRSTTAGGRHPQEVNYTHAPHALSPDDGLEDGAPFPSVASSRRRSARSTERRKSGRNTPEPTETLNAKRSSSRLTRLSGNKTPEPGDRRATTPDPHVSVSYERPESADSVDEAVESYLCSPRLSQKIKHPQTGRVISFSEVGDSEGSAVFCCVGMGLTRYITAFYDELAQTLKLRLITPDRPGVGDSEAYNDGTATPLSWPDDVYAICQALKITKFSILAHSAGAIYALATALRMPQHIRGRIHLLAPWIPPSQMNVFGASQAMPPTNAIPTSQRILRALPTPFLKAANSSFMSATSSSITSSLPKTPRSKTKRKSAAVGKEKRDLTQALEKENLPLELYLPEGKTSPLLATENMDQYRPNPEQGAPVDLLVCLERRHTVGFRYVDITRPVVIHHGSKDTRVPVENVKWLGKTMKRCEVRVLEGEGHGLMASASVMGTVLMEISKEWEDWLRVTGTSKRDGDRERGRSSRAGGR